MTRKKLKNNLFIKFNQILILLIVFIFSFINCKKKNTPVSKVKPENKIAITLSNNTAIRIDPYVFSSRIELLKKGETIKVISQSNTKSWIGKSKDYWFKVRMDNGIEGWTFGKNIKIISSKDKEDISGIVTSFFKGETEDMRKSLEGKWWSINRFGDFTRHGLEFSTSGKYKSYKKLKDPKIISGEYRIDFHNNFLLFDEGSTFGNKLQFVKRGKSYLLKKELKVGELRFKKISEKVDEKSFKRKT